MAKFDLSQLEQKRITMHENGIDYVVPGDCVVTIHFTVDGVVQAVTMQKESDFNDQEFQLLKGNRYA